MDTHASTPELIKMQSQLRFFFDQALQCNNQCVTTYENKNLDDTERECVENCFKKQKFFNDRYYQATQGQGAKK